MQKNFYIISLYNNSVQRTFVAKRHFQPFGSWPGFNYWLQISSNISIPSKFQVETINSINSLSTWPLRVSGMKWREKEKPTTREIAVSLGKNISFIIMYY